ncbi:histidine kinase [Streptomyces sp. enrichment culture]|uniref:ATP-binding protein n=1 Tax=Streptomyces sp. enrichment culture TaxID=1795815 RepID=UPI003F57311E
MSGDSVESKEGQRHGWVPEDQRQGWARGGLSRRQLIAWDAAAAAAFALFYALLAPLQPGHAPSPLLQVPVLLAMSLPLAVRRLWPRAVLASVLVASAAGAVLDIVVEPLLAVAYALYPVAVTTTRTGRTLRRIVVAGSALILLVLVSGGASSKTFGSGLPAWLSGLIVCGLTWGAGQAIRERRAYAERAARQLAVSAVAEERLRIARELHDVVAHHVGVIAVKAGVARHVAAVAPDEAADALRVIDEESRTALQEMRGILGLLRTGRIGEEDEEESRHPGRSLAQETDVRALVRRAGAAGVAVELTMEGLAGLPDGVARAAHRVVQEALTNVIKHAAPCSCRLTLIARRGELWIEVLDDGGGSADRTGRARTGAVGARRDVLRRDASRRDPDRRDGDRRDGTRPDSTRRSSASNRWAGARKDARHAPVEESAPQTGGALAEEPTPATAKERATTDDRSGTSESWGATTEGSTHTKRGGVTDENDAPPPDGIAEPGGASYWNSAHRNVPLGEAVPRKACPQGAGHGLIGMRERVTMYGGELTAGPQPRGGFAVRARIPLPVREKTRPSDPTDTARSTSTSATRPPPSDATGTPPSGITEPPLTNTTPTPLPTGPAPPPTSTAPTPPPAEAAPPSPTGGPDAARAAAPGGAPRPGDHTAAAGPGETEPDSRQEASESS